MPSYLVNLDALIQRDYFEAQTNVMPTPSTLSTTVKVTDLEPSSFTYRSLRKPDFQRETADWEPEKVAALIKSYVNGDLIPAIILWRSPLSGNIFVIDGAHRLSAFISWVHDDYGDGATSLRFFANLIPSEQKKAAERTRMLIKNTVGTYQELRVASEHQGNVDPLRLQYARNLGSVALSLQWVPGDAASAEESFFRINQSSTPIDRTELEMIKSRYKPNALATRALIRAGTGHKYWSAFAPDVQEEIELMARDIYRILFKPSMESPIRTLDVPLAGRAYNAESVRMMFQLVNFINGVSDNMGKKVNAKSEIPTDDNGEATLKYLNAVRKIATRISSTESGSLGLHPIVYFYGATGKFQPEAFLATIAFVKELEAEHNGFIRFTEIRAKMEEFFLNYKLFRNQIVRNYGTLHRSVPHMLTMFQTIYAGLKEGCSDEVVVYRLQAQFHFLTLPTEADKKAGKNFSRETKDATFLRQAIEQELECQICNGKLYFKSISIDHKERREDGGSGTEDNAQLAHLYCNTGYKEAMHATRQPSLL